MWRKTPRKLKFDKWRYGAPIAIAIYIHLELELHHQTWLLSTFWRPSVVASIWWLANCCFCWLSSQDCWLPTAPGWENQTMQQGMCESSERLGVASKQAAVPNEPQVEPQDTTGMGENSTSGTKPGDWWVVSTKNIPFMTKKTWKTHGFSLIFPAFPALPGLHHWSCPNHPKNAGGRVPIAQVPRLGGALVFRDHVVNHGKPNNQTYKHGHFLPLIAPHGHLMAGRGGRGGRGCASARTAQGRQVDASKPRTGVWYPKLCRIISGGSNYPPPNMNNTPIGPNYL